jgi:hypothetical protein
MDGLTGCSAAMMLWERNCFGWLGGVCGGFLVFDVTGYPERRGVRRKRNRLAGWKEEISRVLSCVRSRMLEPALCLAGPRLLCEETWAEYMT